MDTELSIIRKPTGFEANDSLLYLKISSAADTAALQKDFDRLQQWVNDRQVLFNPSNCEGVSITKRRNPIQVNYKIHSHDFTTAKTGKCLGITISDDRSWKAHVNAITKKANNSLFLLSRIQQPAHTM